MKSMCALFAIVMATARAIFAGSRKSWITFRTSASPRFGFFLFIPRRLKDDGYDISDYTNVHPSYGTLEDFQLVVDEAHRGGCEWLRNW